MVMCGYEVKWVWAEELCCCWRLPSGRIEKVSSQTHSYMYLYVQTPALELKLPGFLCLGELQRRGMRGEVFAGLGAARMRGGTWIFCVSTSRFCMSSSRTGVGRLASLAHLASLCQDSIESIVWFNSVDEGKRHNTQRSAGTLTIQPAQTCPFARRRGRRDYVQTTRWQPLHLDKPRSDVGWFLLLHIAHAADDVVLDFRHTHRPISSISQPRLGLSISLPYGTASTCDARSNSTIAPDHRTRDRKALQLAPRVVMDSLPAL